MNFHRCIFCHAEGAPEDDAVVAAEPEVPREDVRSASAARESAAGFTSRAPSVASRLSGYANNKIRGGLQPRVHVHIHVHVHYMYSLLCRKFRDIKFRPV